MANPLGIGGAQPGEVRNPDGGRRARLWKAAIERTVLKPIEGKVDLARLDSLAEALILAGEAGDIAALKEIGDRIDGKVPQGLIGGDEDDKPLFPTKVEVELVRATSKNTDTGSV